MIVDTMVFAYTLLPVEEFRDQAAHALAVADSIEVPDSLCGELANVVWQWIRQRGVSLETGMEILEDANALIDRVISCDSLWEHALELAVETGHAVYDTLFIAAAELAGTRLITFDDKLVRAFPDQTIKPQNSR